MNYSTLSILSGFRKGIKFFCFLSDWIFISNLIFVKIFSITHLESHFEIIFLKIGGGCPLQNPTIKFYVSIIKNLSNYIAEKPKGIDHG